MTKCATQIFITFGSIFAKLLGFEDFIALSFVLEWEKNHIKKNTSKLLKLNYIMRNHIRKHCVSFCSFPTCIYEDIEF